MPKSPEQIPSTEYRQNLADELKAMRQEEGGKKYASELLSEIQKTDEYIEAKLAYRHQKEQEQIKMRIAEKRAEFQKHITSELNLTLEAFQNSGDYPEGSDERLFLWALEKMVNIQKKLKRNEPIGNVELKVAIKESFKYFTGEGLVKILAQSLESGFLSAEEVEQFFFDSLKANNYNYDYDQVYLIGTAGKRLSHAIATEKLLPYIAKLKDKILTHSFLTEAGNQLPRSLFYSMLISCGLMDDENIELLLKDAPHNEKDHGSLSLAHKISLLRDAQKVNPNIDKSKTSELIKEQIEMEKIRLADKMNEVAYYQGLEKKPVTFADTIKIIEDDCRVMGFDV